VAAAAAALLVVVAASGWLFLLRWGHSPGPKPHIADAVPLDELSHRSDITLPLFVGVWALAAIMLGLLARAVRIERLTAAVLISVGVGLWAYLATGLSFAIVRQVAAEQAFRSAAETRAVYVPAILAGIAAALLCPRRPSVSPRAPVVLAWLVGAAGLLGVVHTLFPEHASTLLTSLAPGAHPLARALAAPLGLALVLTSRGLARGRRRAWQLAVALLLGATVLHILHDDYGAASTGLLTVALLARRHNFTGPGEPGVHPRLLARTLLFAAVIYAYGFAVLWTNRMTADQPFTPRFAFAETTRALAGLSLTGSKHISGSFDTWFGPSVLVLGLGALGYLVFSWLAPWRYRLQQEARERELARRLVDAWGADTLAPFVLRADKSYFFTDDERAFVAYRVVRGVAIVSGDPVGPAECFDGLLASFIAYARRCDWRIAILGASERMLELYRRHGLHILYHGDEAVILTDRFSLEGRPIRKVRQSVHRLERAGYRALFLHPREVDPELKAGLESIAREWRNGEPNRGFVMALDALFRLEEDEAVFVIGLGPKGVPAGFLHFALCRRGSALSLSSMPRLRNTPNGFNEWLVCEAVAWARANGLERVSLNFAPFAALLAPEAELSRLQRLERGALLRLKGHFQLDNLLLFNRKFFPSWERRFVVYERRVDLPRVGIAALAAEAYLPFTGRNGR